MRLFVNEEVKLSKITAAHLVLETLNWILYDEGLICSFETKLQDFLDISIFLLQLWKDIKPIDTVNRSTAQFTVDGSAGFEGK